MVNYNFVQAEIKTIWKHVKNKRYEIKSFINSNGYVKYIIFYDKQAKKPCTGKVVSKFLEGEVCHWPKLRHKNLAPLTDVIYIDERIAIYMTSYFRQSLRELIHNEEFMNNPQCFSKKGVYTKDILSGIDYLHSKKLSLMNISDANIFINHELDKAVICDFTCLDTFDKAVRHKRCGSLLSRNFLKIPEISTGTKYGRSDKFNSILADIWSVGIMILEIFLCHMTPWGYVDYDSRRVLELCANVDQNLLQLANKGSIITLQDAETFKHFITSFFEFNPKNRCSVKSALSKKFIKTVSKDIEKLTSQFNENNDESLSSTTHEAEGIEDVYPLCDIFEEQSLHETKPECNKSLSTTTRTKTFEWQQIPSTAKSLSISRQIPFDQPREMIKEPNSKQNNNISPEVNTKISDSDLNLTPTKVVFEKCKVATKLEEADCNRVSNADAYTNNNDNTQTKIIVNPCLSLKSENISQPNHIFHNMTRVSSLPCNVRNFTKRAALHNLNDDYEFGLKKVKNENNITDTNRICKTDLEGNLKESGKTENLDSLDLLYHKNQPQTIKKSTNSLNLKMNLQMPSNALVLRQLKYPTNDLSPTINNHLLKKRGYISKTIDNDLSYLKNKAISNDQLYCTNNVNTGYNITSKTTVNMSDEAQVKLQTRSGSRSSIGTLKQIPKTEFYNISEPSTSSYINGTVPKKIKYIKNNYGSNQSAFYNKGSSLKTRHSKFCCRNKDAERTPLLFDQTEEHRLQNMHKLKGRTLRIIKHERGCPHYDHGLLRENRYRYCYQSPQSFPLTNGISAKQKCENSKFLLNTEEKNRHSTNSFKADEKSEKSEKKGKKNIPRHYDVDDEDEAETRKYYKTRKFLCLA